MGSVRREAPSSAPSPPPTLDATAFRPPAFTPAPAMFYEQPLDYAATAAPELPLQNDAIATPLPIRGILLMADDRPHHTPVPQPHAQTEQASGVYIDFNDKDGPVTAKQEHALHHLLGKVEVGGVARIGSMKGGRKRIWSHTIQSETKAPSSRSKRR